MPSHSAKTKFHVFWDLMDFLCTGKEQIIKHVSMIFGFAFKNVLPDKYDDFPSGSIVKRLI